MEKDDNSLIFDVGDVEAGYLPGHAHADTLSVECSINGKNLIVNSGQIIESFRHFGDHKAHSTVTINGFIL